MPLASFSQLKYTPLGRICTSSRSLATSIPTKASLAQATFDADVNNLFLATIRSLKGTGRVMEQELNQIAQSAPNNSDSNEVKMAKAQAHMQYYTQRMRSLGYDPSTGQPAGVQPVDASQLNAPVGGGNPLPPSPDQIQSATHRYNPATGQLEPIQ